MRSTAQGPHGQPTKSLLQKRELLRGLCKLCERAPGDGTAAPEGLCCRPSEVTGHLKGGHDAYPVMSHQVPQNLPCAMCAVGNDGKLGQRIIIPPRVQNL